MYSRLIDDISDYVDYLRNECALQITIHPMHDGNTLSVSDLMKYNLHYNAYCIYLKTDPVLWTKCVACQQKVRDRCKTGAYFGVCHAGAAEFIYPIDSGHGVTGFVSIGGYWAGEEGLTRCKSICAKYGLDFETARQLYEHGLNRQIPSQRDVDRVVIPLIRMIEYAYLLAESAPNESGSHLYLDLLRYINRHYTEQITVSQIARRHHYSVSCISHTFKKNNGLSISEYVNKLRCEAAKDVLRHSDATVAAIAGAVGFANAYYFSRVFKLHVGVSPRVFRSSGL